jgi:hypothetical protein
MTAPTVRDLRRQWKPHKERLIAMKPGHATHVRFHRACSWLQRSEEVTDAADLDWAILSQWIAFNALYGQWDHALREPVADTVCWRHFLDRMLALDESQFIVNRLVENKPLVMSIFDDEFLSRYFWQEPNDKRARQSKKTKFNARTWYLEGNWTLILDRLIERVYLLRCQLVHGAATYNSALNRTATGRCARMMDHVLRAFLQVWVHHGADEDWGIMCYPPMTS